LEEMSRAMLTGIWVETFEPEDALKDCRPTKKYGRNKPIADVCNYSSIAAQKHEGDTAIQLNHINQLLTETNKLRADNESTCEQIAKIRERVATLEAKAVQPPVGK
jgi:hypothetical protein